VIISFSHATGTERCQRWQHGMLYVLLYSTV